MVGNGFSNTQPYLLIYSFTLFIHLVMFFKTYFLLKNHMVLTCNIPCVVEIRRDLFYTKSWGYLSSSIH